VLPNNFSFFPYLWSVTYFTIYIWGEYSQFRIEFSEEPLVICMYKYSSFQNIDKCPACHAPWAPAALTARTARPGSLWTSPLSRPECWWMTILGIKKEI